MVAAVHNDKWQDAIMSTAEVIIHLNLSIFSVKEYAEQVLLKGKILLVHLDLLEGIAKDKSVPQNTVLFPIALAFAI